MDFETLMSQYKGEHHEAQPAPTTSASRPRSYVRKSRVEQDKQPAKVSNPVVGEYKLENMLGRYELWNEEWVAGPDDMLVTFQAKADNDVTIGLFTEMNITTGNMYEVVIGGWKNTKSVVRTEVQGPERAVSFDPRMCNSEAFMSYWVVLSNGRIGVGTGDRPGAQTLLAWQNQHHDVEDIQPCYMALTAWDKQVYVKSIKVSRASSLDYNWTDLARPEDSWPERFIPSYVKAFEEERAINLARAERFGVEFQVPDIKRALAKLPHEEREKARASQAGRLRGGFATGFDLQTPEEIKAREARAARFGLDPTTTSTTVAAAVPLLPSAEELEAKRQRAERFGVPLTEQAKVVQLALQLPIKMRAVQTGEVVRDDAIHIFGDFAGVTTGLVLRAFSSYDPSHVEWLNDCSCNVCFADAFTRERAFHGMTREVPPPLPVNSEQSLSSERAAFEDELRKIIAGGWKFSALKDRREEAKYMLVRRATSGDIKGAGNNTTQEASSAPPNEENEPRKRVRVTESDS